MTLYSSMEKHHNIILIGPMGAGKTTIGKKIADGLGMVFFDVDEELEKSTGVSVNLIFEIEKETGFRLRESEMLDQLLKKQNAVIATGGGIVISEPNRDLIKNSHATVVYLKTEVKHQLQRLQRDKKRPLLHGKGRRMRLKNMAKLRNPLYEQIATVTWKSSRISPYVIAQQIVKRLKVYL